MDEASTREKYVRLNDREQKRQSKWKADRDEWKRRRHVRCAEQMKINLRRFKARGEAHLKPIDREMSRLRNQMAKVRSKGMQAKHRLSQLRAEYDGVKRRFDALQGQRDSVLRSYNDAAAEAKTKNHDNCEAKMNSELREVDNKEYERHRSVENQLRAMDKQLRMWERERIATEELERNFREAAAAEEQRRWNLHVDMMKRSRAAKAAREEEVRRLVEETWEALGKMQSSYEDLGINYDMRKPETPGSLIFRRLVLLSDGDLTTDEVRNELRKIYKERAQGHTDKTGNKNFDAHRLTEAKRRILGRKRKRRLTLGLRW